MDIRQGAVIAIPVALIVGSAVTAAACRWWYGRKLRAAAERLDKLDKKRLFSQEQTLQARRQIEQLKADIAAQQRSAADRESSQRRAALDEVVQAAPVAPAPSSGFLPLAAPHGFADTQVLAE